MVVSGLMLMPEVSRQDTGVQRMRCDQKERLRR
ncbi:MAG: hypothetical protein ACI9ND_003113, partial [Yoonia sp.]